MTLIYVELGGSSKLESIGELTLEQLLAGLVEDSFEGVRHKVARIFKLEAALRFREVMKRIVSRWIVVLSDVLRTLILRLHLNYFYSS